MCDAFGLEHKLVPVPDEPLLMDVEVWKHYAAYNMEILPPHLPQLLRKDAKIDPTGRMFDGLPLFWAEASAELRAMDDEKLSIVAQRLLNAMVNYPSPSWALLVVELLRERKIPLPLGMMRSIMKMCKKRDDLYSLLEVLHTAHVELELAKTVTYKRKLFQLRNHSKYAADVSIESITEELDDASFEVEDPTGERSVADSLNSVDWNNACVLAFRSKHANLPGNSYQEIYTEVQKSAFLGVLL